MGNNGTLKKWNYLNKGTHEESDRAEFDRQIALEIISNLEEIDAALG